MIRKVNGKFAYRLLASLFFLVTFVFRGSCFALQEQKTQDITGQIIEKQTRTDGINAIIDELKKHTDGEGGEVLEGFDPDEIIKNLTEGTLGFDIKTVGANALRFFFKELYQNLSILVKLSALIVLCALLKNLQSNFVGDGVGSIAFYACYIVIVSMLMVSFGIVVKMGTDIIGKMAAFMYVAIPVMLALLISGGNISAGGILHPVLLMIVEVSATVIKNVFVPLVFMSTILSIVSNISEKIQLTRLASLLKQIITWSLGTLLTIFVVVISLQGSLGAVIDGATSKAAKFVVSTFIPVVGKMLADAAETVIGCTLLIKNAAGAAAMICILIICITPLLRIIALVMVYKAASALFEPISEKRITNCINDVAGSMLFIFALTAAVAFMFIISLTALVSVGNMSAMLR